MIYLNKTKEIVLNSRNVYYDKHKRAIYYNKRKGIGYVIPKESEGRFQTLSYRFIIGIIVIIFAEIFFFHNLLFSVPAGIAAYAFLEYQYQRFLSGLPQLKNFEPEKAKSTTEKQMELSTGSLLLRCGLYFALAILLILNLFTTKGLSNDIAIVVLSCIAAIGSLYMSLRFAYIFLKKNKLKK